MWSEAKCESNGDVSAQRLDGKVVPDLTSFDDADDIDTMLAEFGTIIGDNPQARQLVVTSGADLGLKPMASAIVDLPSADCPTTLTRSLAATGTPPNGVPLTGLICDTTRPPGKPFGLSEVTGAKLTAAIAAGLKVIEGNFKSAEIESRDTVGLVVQVPTDKAGGTVDVSLDGKASTVETSNSTGLVHIKEAGSPSGTMSRCRRHNTVRARANSTTSNCF